MSVPSTGATRDRIIDAAMHLFSEHGYRGTSITKIEEAAGLTPGAGGIYHHFTSKEALLEAGVRRQLARLSALRDIRRLFADLGDLRAELTLTARYVLSELDQETELLRLLISEARHGPTVLQDAVGELVGSAYLDFAEWIGDRPGSTLSPESAKAIAALGLGALMSSRLVTSLLGTTPGDVDDDTLVQTWVSAVHHLISTGQAAAPTATA